METQPRSKMLLVIAVIVVLAAFFAGLIMKATNGDSPAAPPVSYAAQDEIGTVQDEIGIVSGFDYRPVFPVADAAGIVRPDAIPATPAVADWSLMIAAADGKATCSPEAVQVAIDLPTAHNKVVHFVGEYDYPEIFVERISGAWYARATQPLSMAATTPRGVVVGYIGNHGYRGLEEVVLSDSRGYAGAINALFCFGGR